MPPSLASISSSLPTWALSTLAEGKSLLKYYDDGLEGYTYLEE